MNTVPNHPSYARRIYEAVYKGDPISDEDLAYGIKHFTALSNQLMDLGPIFYHAWYDIARLVDTLEQFQAARNRK